MTAKGCDFRICFCLFLEIGLWLRSGNPEVWAQTGRSLRSAPMIAMRDKPAIAVRVVSDCFSNTATAAKNTIVGLQRLSEEASQKDCLRKLTFK